MSKNIVRLQLILEFFLSFCKFKNLGLIFLCFIEPWMEDGETQQRPSFIIIIIIIIINVSMKCIKYKKYTQFLYLIYCLKVSKSCFRKW